MVDKTIGIHCSHESGPSEPCPFLCQAWLNSFPWDKSNARFDNSDAFSHFLKHVEILSAGDIFDSIDLVYDSKLNSVVENVRSNIVNIEKDENWKEVLVEELQKLESLPTLNDTQLTIFKQLVEKKLMHNISDQKSRVIPTVVIMSPEEDDEEKLNIQMVFNHQRKKKRNLTAQDIALMHKTLPELSSVVIKDMHFKVEGYEDIDVSDNLVETLDITLGNQIGSPSGLLALLLKSYHKTIKSFKLESSKYLNLSSQQPKIEQGKHIKKLFRENELTFDHLQHLEINNFLNWIDITTLLRKLATTNCALKSATFLGQEKLGDIITYLTKKYSRSLESLVLSCQTYHDIRTLSSLTSLKHLSFFWEAHDEKVDILKALMILPNLTSLELGHKKRQGIIVSNMVSFDTYNSLNTLSLSNLHIESDLFEKLSSQLPNLKNVTLINCKIGSSRTIEETTLTFGNNILDSLVMEDCSLFYAMKDKKSKKRAISRYILAMISPEPYVATIRSSFNDESRNGRLSVEGEFFVYELPLTDKQPLTTNSLLIKANLIRSFSTSKNSPMHVALCPESELESDEEGEEADAEEIEKADAEEVGEDADEKVEEVADEEAEEEVGEDADEKVEEVADEEAEEDVDEDIEAEEVEEADVEEVEKADVEEVKEADAEEVEEDDVEETEDTDAEEEEDIETEDIKDIEELEEAEALKESQLDVVETKDDNSLPEILETYIQKETVDNNSTRYESGTESVEQEEFELDISVEEVIPKVIESESELDDVPMSPVRSLRNRSSKKKNTEDYFSNLEDILISSTDSEYDDDMGTVKKSLRKGSKKTLPRQAKSNNESRKRERVLFFTSEEEEEEREENDMIAEFIRNCKEFDAVIRIPPRKRAKSQSPSL